MDLLTGAEVMRLPQVVTPISAHGRPTPSVWLLPPARSNLPVCTNRRAPRKRAPGGRSTTIPRCPTCPRTLRPSCSTIVLDGQLLSQSRWCWLSTGTWSLPVFALRGDRTLALSRDPNAD